MWLKLLVLAVVIGFLYFDIVNRLISQWTNDQNYSHGFFVPLFSGYVLWEQRKRLAELDAEPSWWGMFAALGAIGVLIAGVFGAELFLSRSSLVLLIGSVVIYFQGWRFFRAVFFPWAFLFLMIPIPNIIFNQLAFPLQTLASKLATAQLQLLGVPVLREGNVIQLPAMALEVVEACSGIRSLMSLGTLAIIYGYFIEARVSRRVILALASIPIAVVANAWRVTGTGLLGQYWEPEKAQGFFHTFSGWLIFVLSLFLLFAFHGVMKIFDRWASRRREGAKA